VSEELLADLSASGDCLRGTLEIHGAALTLRSRRTLASGLIANYLKRTEEALRTDLIDLCDHYVNKRRSQERLFLNVSKSGGYFHQSY
jgi:hypothetical protein